MPFPCLLAWVLAGWACRASPVSRTGAPGADGGGTAAAPGEAGRTAPTLVAPSRNPADAGGAVAAAAFDAAGADARGFLQAEEPDRDPGSDMVTIKLLVDPPKRARVFWGPKDLGTAPLEIRRPRGSGPLDLILRAPGYLTVHTRAFTDRDDQVAIHLVPETEAPRMFGYRAPPPLP